jgi:hypothetical protein
MRRLRPADVLAGIGGLVLFGSLFLTWYGRVFLTPGELGSSGEPRYPVSAWRAFSVIDVVLAAIAVLAIAIPLAVALLPRRVSLPVTLAILTSVAGIVATLLVIFRLIFQPGPNALLAFVVVRPGAWVGFAGALLVTAGGWLSLADERTPGAVPPRVPRRPAPPDAPS